MAYIREVVIEGALVKECQKRGGIAYKLTVPGRVNVPDRLLLMPGGRVIFVECKAPGQAPRAGQQRELARLRALGFECHTLDSTDSSHIFETKPLLFVEQVDPHHRVDSGYRNRKLKNA